MPNLNLRSFSVLVANGTAAVQAACSQVVDFTPGSVIRSFVEAVAATGLWVQELTYQVLLSNRLATSTGLDCDTFGADFGFSDPTRVNNGTSSTGIVTFSRFVGNSSVVIPLYQADLITPTTVKTFDGTQTFKITFDPTNLTYDASQNSGTGGYVMQLNVLSLNVPVVAQSTGIITNVQPNTITLISSTIPGVDSVTNTAAMTSGQNATSDTLFKAHFVNWVNSRSLGTLLAVQSAVQTTQGVTSFSIVENSDANGNTIMGMFIVTIDDGTGAPQASLVQAVSTNVSLVRPIGSSFIIRVPSVLTANVAMTITAAPGYTKSTMIGPVQLAVTAYIQSLGVSGDLYYTKIIQVAWDAVAGLSNVSAITINGSTADIIASQFQIIEPGTITIS